MKLLSLNVGKKQTVQWKNKSTKTAFFKRPVQEPLQVSFLTIIGDEQADPRFHGGETKAVYAYDIAHYDQWKKILPRDDWQPGMFGENLTSEGLQDNEVKVGNIYKIGTTKLQAMEPRFPCMKLNMRFQLSTMAKLFRQQERSGIYFKVIEEGTVKAGDAIELVQASAYDVTIHQLVTCYYSKGADRALLEKIVGIDYLPIKLKREFESFL